MPADRANPPESLSAPDPRPMDRGKQPTDGQLRSVGGRTCTTRDGKRS